MILAHAVRLERLVVLEDVPFVDEPLLRGWRVSLVRGLQRRLQLADRDAQLEGHGDLAAAGRLDVYRRRRHGRSIVKTTNAPRDVGQEPGVVRQICQI